MIEVTKGKKYELSAVYLVNDVDATIAGSQTWTVDSALATIEPQANGTALLTAVDVGVVNIDYLAKGNNGSGEVPLFGKETLNISEVIVPEPVQVTIQVKEVV